jgi:hypothetical protein
VLLNKAVKRLYVKPQSWPHLHAGKFPKPGLFVGRVHLQTELFGGLRYIQEPLFPRCCGINAAPVLNRAA